MIAKDITGTPPGGQRIPLSQLVPLDTPLLIQIFPVYACNFKCKYCVFSIPTNERKFISDVPKITFDLFKKCVDDCHNFMHKIKVLRFVGMGEPLLHPQLADMIAYAKQSDCFMHIEILTNGSLLTAELSHKLINAGLDKLLVSIQGTSCKKYKEISNIDIDLNKFVKNLTYFYNHRNNTKVHIKIIDCALEDEEDIERFHNLFGNCCDTIGIEKAGPIHPGVEFNKTLETSNTTNQYGVIRQIHNICPQPFFAMQINPDGNIVPCYAVPYTQILGNCYYESLVNIWNGKTFNQFRLKMLDGITNVHSTCAECQITQHRAFDSDDLSTIKEILKDYYEKS